jgi:predicted nicotinamide N-methyase
MVQNQLFVRASVAVFVVVITVTGCYAWIQPLMVIRKKSGSRGMIHDTVVNLVEIDRKKYKANERGAARGIRQRVVPIDSDWNITVWEYAEPASVIEHYWANVHQQGNQTTTLDPFGIVMWPGSVVAALEMKRRKVVQGQHVLILGAGVGIEAFAAAQLGATSVLATDIHPTTIQLLKYGAQQAGCDDVIVSSIFDITDHTTPLPVCDLMIVADVLYNDHLASHIARRCYQARSLSLPPTILITDSQRFVSNFTDCLNSLLNANGKHQNNATWTNCTLTNFTGSGVMVDEDQTYSVHVRTLWIGLE